MIPPVASQFIAGKNNKTAVKNAENIDGQTVPILNYLGEHYQTKKPVKKTVNEYLDLIDTISASNSNMEISIKPTQVGLDIDENLFTKNTEKIVQKSVEKGIFVWIDMENPPTIDPTVALYEYFAREYPGQVGLCMQANMKRTSNDLRKIADYSGASVRVVKGAYTPSSKIAYTDKETIDKKYKELIERALTSIEGRVAIGTHDEQMIEKALSVENMTAEMEFQMLRGVREDRQRELSKQYRVGQYIPYGEKWMSYTYRRIRERPRNILLIGRAIKNSIF